MHTTRERRVTLLFTDEEYETLTKLWKTKEYVSLSHFIRCAIKDLIERETERSDT